MQGFGREGQVNEDRIYIPDVPGSGIGRFRHTHASFRLTEGIDVYFLVKQIDGHVREDDRGQLRAHNAAQECRPYSPGPSWMAVQPAVGQRLTWPKGGQASWGPRRCAAAR